jgi:hypothetical protein
MQEYLNIGARFWADFLSWNPPELTLYAIVGFGLLSSWIMTRVAASPPLFVGPISFITLTFAAMIGNFMGRSVVMMGTSEVQKALLFTVAGHCIAGILLLAVLKVAVNTRRV